MPLPLVAKAKTISFEINTIYNVAKNHRWRNQQSLNL